MRKHAICWSALGTHAAVMEAALLRMPNPLRLCAIDAQWQGTRVLPCR